MNRGYVKLWRKTKESRIFQNEGLLKVWIWCLLKANHKKAWVSIKTGRGQVEVKVNPGQFIFGRDSAAKELGMSPSTVYKRIKKLKNIENCNIKSNRQYSVITILNWDSYQSEKIKSNSKGNNQVTTKERASNTNKNDKHDKNNKGSPSVSFLKNNLDEKLSEFFKSIKNTCEQIQKLSSNGGKQFNPYQWTQQQLNKKKHPGAIDETLKAIADYWETTNEPWSYATSIMITKNQNWNERESIEIHNKLKGMSVPEELKNLTSGMFKSF